MKSKTSSVNSNSLFSEKDLTESQEKDQDFFFIAIQRVIEVMKSMPKEDFVKMQDQNYVVSITVKKITPINKEIIQADLALHPQLMSFSNREDAMHFVISNYKTKKSLEDLARYYSIAISKSEKITDLQSKIVEGTVGARIRSLSIQG